MGLWILLILLFIFVILPLGLCLLPVYIRLYNDEDGNPQFSIKILCFPISLEKKKAKEEKKDSQVLGHLGLNQYSSAGNLKRSISEKGFSATLKHFTGILKLFFSVLGQAARKFRVCRARLKIVTAGENAALEYGIASATLYPLSAFLQNHSQVKKRAVKTNIHCDFEGFEAEISYDLILRIFVGSFIPILLRILKTLWKENKAYEGK